MVDTLPKVQSARMQVEAALYALIEAAKPGEQLPPEPLLAQQLGSSRATLREVIRTLVERGYLARRQEIGTFVISRIPVLETGMELLESLERMSQRIGLQTEVAELEVEERRATRTEATGLALSDDTQTEVLVVNRVITVKGRPVADLRDIVPVAYLRQADLGSSFGGSVLDLLLKRGSPLLTSSRTDILAVAAEEKLARRLDIHTGAPLLRLTGQLYSFDERIVDYSVSYFVPGHFRFHVMRRVQG